MDKVINIAKISDFNELKAGDKYTQVNFKSHSYTPFHSGMSLKSLSCVCFPLSLNSLERTISYISSDYILIQENIILLNVEFENKSNE